MDQRTPPSWRQSEGSGELGVGNCLVYMWIWLKQTSPLRASVYLKHGVWGKMGTLKSLQEWKEGYRDWGQLGQWAEGHKDGGWTTENQRGIEIGARGARGAEGHRDGG